MLALSTFLFQKVACHEAVHVEQTLAQTAHCVSCNCLGFSVERSYVAPMPSDMP